MAFGKKSQEKNHKAKMQTVAMSQNPLYIDRKESPVRESLTAVGIAFVAVILFVLIMSNFSSYSSSGYERAYANERTGTISESFVTDPALDPAAGSAAVSQFILEGSNVRYISESELAGMMEEQLWYARNEIYARHGRRFDDAGLQSYFDSKDWYNGTIVPEDFDEASLSEMEKPILRRSWPMRQLRGTDRQKRAVV